MIYERQVIAIIETPNRDDYKEILLYKINPISNTDHAYEILHDLLFMFNESISKEEREAIYDSDDYHIQLINPVLLEEPIVINNKKYNRISKIIIKKYRYLEVSNLEKKVSE